MKLNEIDIQGFVLLEPIGSLTDFITGVTGLVIAYLIWKSKPRERSMQLFNLYFLFTGIATVCAGTIGHAFLYYLSPEWKMVGWSFSAIGLFCFERASFEYFKKELSGRFYKSLKIITLVQLLVFYLLIALPVTRSFKIVQLNATFCYVAIIFPLYFYAIFKWKIPEAWYIISGIFMAVIIAIVYNTQVTIHKWFNHHALTHVLMTLYVIYMYYAVRKLHHNKNRNLG